ncbi:MAG: VOC family protein [Serratia marcescens]|nr:VOC family protein [Serratia marcescens]
MATQIFVNLPVRDLPASMAFFTRLGFTFNPQFTDDTAACMVVSDTIYVMLLTHDKFRGFTPNPIGDAKQATEVLVCLSQPSRAAVDELVRKAVAGGGNTYHPPRDYGVMYGHGFQDLDGHIWGLMYMDPAAVQAQ